MKIKTALLLSLCSVTGFHAFSAETPAVVPVDIRRAANMGFRDEIANDRQGGWSDQGAENDLRIMRPGKIVCEPAVFSVADPAANKGRAAIVVGATPVRQDYASSIRVDMKGERIRTVFLLHAATWLRKGRTLGYIRATFTDGTQEEVPVVAGRDVGDWWNPFRVENGFVAWKGRNQKANVGLYASAFSFSGKPVANLLFRRSGVHSLWMIAAVSCSEKKTGITAREPERFFEAGADWLEYQYDREVVAGSALDFSFLLDAPAGKYGPLKIENGHFVFEKRRTPQRFYGANICFSACFPSHEQAEHLADRFARTGYNVIRMHHFDSGLLPKDRKDSVTLDPGQLDRFEYFIAALKKRGIYLTLDLFTCRTPMPGEFPDVKNDRDYKIAAMLLPEVNANLKAFSRNLLLHRNPYTGFSLVEEPALLNVSVVNENTLFHIINKGTGDAIRKRFSDEFARRHPDGMKKGKPDPEQYRKFLAGVYADYWRDMVAFLRGLGLKVPLTEQNFIFSPNLAVDRSRYDYVDTHLYWDHPIFPERAWKLPMLFHGKSAIAERLRYPLEILPVRIFGKPFAVSEFDFSGPGDFRMQGTPLMAAYAALQDWDSLNRFTYSHSLNTMFNVGFGCFDAANDPVRLLGDRLAEAFFLRGDVKPASEAVPVLVSSESARRYTPGYPAGAYELGLVCRTGSVVRENGAFRLPAGSKAVYAHDPSVKESFYRTLPVLRNAKNEFTSVMSSTGELSADFRADTFRAVTARSEALMLPAGKVLNGDFLSVANRRGYAVAGAIALDEKPLSASGRILLLHIANVRRSGMRFRGDSLLMTQWGTGALLAQKAVMDFTLKVPDEHVELYALDFGGARLGKVPFRFAGGKLSFTADTFAFFKPVFAYELIRGNAKK